MEVSVTECGRRERPSPSFRSERGKTSASTALRVQFLDEFQYIDHRLCTDLRPSFPRTEPRDILSVNESTTRGNSVDYGSQSLATFLWTSVGLDVDNYVDTAPSGVGTPRYRVGPTSQHNLPSTSQTQRNH